MALENAPIIAHRMHGEPVQGLLHGFDYSRSKLTVRVSSETFTIIEFTDLRFLVFTQPLSPPPGERLPTIQTTTETTTGDTKAFELIFNDGRKFHATARTILLEPLGIHIFVEKNNGHVYRLFVPKATLNKYNLDMSIGPGLIEHRVVNLETKTATIGVAANNTYEKISAKKENIRIRSTNPRKISLMPAATCKRELINRLAIKWPLPAEHLGEILLSQDIITENQLHDALSFQAQHPDRRIAEILVEEGIATSSNISAALAYKLGLPFVTLTSFDIENSTLVHLPKDLAVRLHLIPLFIQNDSLVIAMSDPTNSDACKMTEFMTQHRIEVTVATQEDIDAAIGRHYRRQEDDEVISHFECIDEFDKEMGEEEIKETEHLSNKKSVVRLVQNIIIEAVDRKASDIHIRPGEHSVDIIFRIDGSLTNLRDISKAIHSALVSRIKIIGRMDISERRVPQDGRASITLRGNKIDFRISIMPTVNGESVVIRILDTLTGLRSIDQLGFGPRDQALFRDMVSRSYGILLVTGPTGSGKSTTLYAALQHVKKDNVNIITVEDPVEYRISGIEQMQVNHKINNTFARILRNILRHDPDVIMVGEIRDQETAKIAIESALTGHLVLSTLHTNSAAVTITRLLEMGVDPYLINDTLLGVLAQRLVRINCPSCIEEEEVAPSVYDALGLGGEEKFYHGHGCENCNYTGYKGRMAVYELLQMTMEMREHVLKKVSAEAIHEAAISGGMIPLTQNALNVARARKTSLAEVYRVRLE